MTRVKLPLLTANLALILLLEPGCSTSARPARGLRSYLEAQQNYARALEGAYGTTSYRLAVIPPLVQPYRPGTALAPGSAEPLTNSCLLRDREPIPVALPPTPALGGKSSFSTKAKLPQMIAAAIQEVADFAASFSLSNEASLQYTDLSIVNPASDILNSSFLTPDCLFQIAGKEVVVVRGLISGVEENVSKRTLGGDATVKILTNDSLEVKFDRNGGWEVKDEKPQPKFWILTSVRVEVPSLRPGMTVDERREAIANFLRGEAPKVLRETRPSVETAQAVTDKAAAVSGR